jgi:hypothetical protein
VLGLTVLQSVRALLAALRTRREHRKLDASGLWAHGRPGVRPSLLLPPLPLLGVVVIGGVVLLSIRGGPSAVGVLVPGLFAVLGPCLIAGGAVAAARGRAADGREVHRRYPGASSTFRPAVDQRVRVRHDPGHPAEFGVAELSLGGVGAGLALNAGGG